MKFFWGEGLVHRIFRTYYRTWNINLLFCCYKSIHFCIFSFCSVLGRNLIKSFPLQLSTPLFLLPLHLKLFLSYIISCIKCRYSVLLSRLFNYLLGDLFIYLFEVLGLELRAYTLSHSISHFLCWVFSR
jgi:hypothetical protein